MLPEIEILEARRIAELAAVADDSYVSGGSRHRIAPSSGFLDGKVALGSTSGKAMKLLEADEAAGDREERFSRSRSPAPSST